MSAKIVNKISRVTNRSDWYDYSEKKLKAQAFHGGAPNDISTFYIDEMEEREIWEYSDNRVYPKKKAIARGDLFCSQIRQKEPRCIISSKKEDNKDKHIVLSAPCAVDEIALILAELSSLTIR
ncbi:MAG: hypothetical protein LBI01_00250 [Elusimicrobium sp.]|jgi:hypothetical protein|nr:hypothetical protein [Elusimicrobium sp.]